MADMIYDTQDFELVSYGNGTAYTLQRKSDEKTIHWQGDDALQFKTDMDIWEYWHPNGPFNDYFKQVWETYK